MPNPLIQKRADDQAKFMQLLLDKARARFKQEPFPLVLPNVKGHVLVDVELTAAEMPDGMVMGNRVRVSLDVLNDPTFSADEYPKANMIAGLSQQLTYAKAPELLDSVVGDKQIDKGSVIDLTGEFTDHLSLMARSYQHALRDMGIALSDEQVRQVVFRAMESFCDRTLCLYEVQALMLASDEGGVVNVQTLNERLDAGRKSLRGTAHEKLLECLVPVVEAVKDKEAFTFAEQIKMLERVFEGHLPEHTLASPDSRLVVDFQHQEAILIATPTDGCTAHTRAPDVTADRELVRARVSSDGKAITCASHMSVTVRTPALDLKAKQFDEVKDSAQVADKLGKLAARYFNATTAPGKLNERGKPQAFVYNLLTSNYFGRLTPGSGEGKNKQTQGAFVILQGVHQYNQSCLSRGGPICLLQNLAVNGFGDAISYQTSVSISDPKRRQRKELALMADMAMMHTLYDCIDWDSDKDAQGKYIEINQFYGRFLAAYPKPANFHQFGEKEWAIKQMKALQGAKLPIKAPDSAPASILFLAQNALLSIFKQPDELRFKTGYGQLVQVLSVFIEEANIAGCKSANERAQHVFSRSGALGEAHDLLSDPENQAKIERLSTGKPPEDHQDLLLIQAMQINKALSQDLSKPGNIKALMQVLTGTYGAAGMERGFTHVSRTDQGPAKLQSPGDKKIKRAESLVNTNFGETAPVKAEKASALQAHKGALDEVENQIKRLLEASQSATRVVEAFSSPGRLQPEKPVNSWQKRVQEFTKPKSGPAEDEPTESQSYRRRSRHIESSDGEAYRERAKRASMLGSEQQEQLDELREKEEPQDEPGGHKPDGGTKP